MNNYFCVMPFFGAEYDHTGFLSPCCLIKPGSDIDQIKYEMLNGIQPVACDKCWSLEKAGNTSDRILKNSAYDLYANRDIRFIEDDCNKGDYRPRIIKIYTSNLCNSTCVTCDHNASTAWGALTNNKKLIQINQSILDQFPLQDFVILNFVGGEPLYEQRNFEILEGLLSVGNTDCFISFTTNGSTKLTNKQKQILSKFKNINLTLSIDGIGRRFEYIRYPLKWSELLDNLKFYREQNIIVNVSYTISNLNVLYYQETVDWFKQNNLNYNHNIVVDPIYFSPNALPKNLKLNHLGFFDTHKDKDDDNFKLFCEEIRRQDQLKGINISDYLPELARNIV